MFDIKLSGVKEILYYDDINNLLLLYHNQKFVYLNDMHVLIIIFVIIYVLHTSIKYYLYLQMFTFIILTYKEFIY